MVDNTCPAIGAGHVLFANMSSLFPQVSQVLFDRLELELELRLVLFELLDLFSFGQELALKTAASTITTTTALAGFVLAVTGFVRHFVILSY
jgi:hypothetical protein